MFKTKCDIIRDVVATNEFCSICTPQTCSAALPCPPGQKCTGLSIDKDTNLLINYCVGVPASCAKAGTLIDEGLCDVPKYLDAKMRVFASKYLSLGRGVASELAVNDATLVQQVQQQLANIYPRNVSDIMSLSWADLEKCAVDPGAATAPGSSAYFSRKDYNNMSNPAAPWKYPLGRLKGAGTIWKSTLAPSPMPLYVDYVMNPDLAAIVLFTFIVLLFAGLMLNARQKNISQARLSRGALPRTRTPSQ